MKILGIIVAAVVILIMVLVASINMWIMPLVKDQVMAEVREGTDLDVSLDALSFSLPNRVHLSGLGVKEEGEISISASVKKITVPIDWGMILRGAIGVGVVVVDEPDILLTRRASRGGSRSGSFLSPSALSFALPIKPSSAGSESSARPPYTGPDSSAPESFEGPTTVSAERSLSSIRLVRVQNGRVQIVDQLDEETRTFSFDHINMSVGPIELPFEGAESFQFEISTESPSFGEPARAHLGGDFNPSTKGATAQVQVTGLNIARLESSSVNQRGYIKAGWADVFLEAEVENHAVDAHCRAEVYGLKLSKKVNEKDILGIPIVFFMDFLAGKEGQLTLEFPVRGSLDQVSVDWKAMFLSGARRSLQRTMGADLDRFLKMGEQVIGNVLQDNLGGLKGLLGNEKGLDQKLDGLKGLFKDVMKQPPTETEQ
jgi:hypothetical protein